MRFGCGSKMRLLLFVGLQVVSLYAGTLNDQPNPDSIVFREDEPNTADPEFSKRANEAATNSASAFAVNFFKAVGKENSGNLICSPISASTSLSMLSYGAVGETKDQLRAALLFPYNEDILKTGFQNLVENLTSYTKVDLKIANKIFLRKGIRLKDSFRDIATDVFRSGVAEVDFSDQLGTSAKINRWCEEQTNSRIKDIIKPDDINGRADLILLNAVYFKGLWLTKFKPEYTRERGFFIDGIKETRIMSMFVPGKFRLGQLPGVESDFIELPYKSEDANHNVSMFIILPWKKDGLANLEAKFEQVTMRELLSHRHEESEVYVTLPKFKIQSTIRLQRPLQNMGMNNLFVRAELTELVYYSDLNVDSIVQKAFIEIDELGSEASSVTLSVVTALSLDYHDEPRGFIADHPFVVVIGTVNDNPVNLFTARFTGRE